MRLPLVLPGLLLFAAASAGPAYGDSSRPNIIVLMADDIGMECYGAYGSTHYKTPNFDTLAASGARFTHAYSQPLCTPSRVKIMTGLYNFRNYVDFGSMDVSKPTFATMMRDAGYKTCAAGKWQLTPGDLQGPHTAGFQDYLLWHFLDRSEGAADKFGSKGSRYQSPVLFENGRLVPDMEGKYGPQVVTDYICNYMEKNKNQPFFVYYPMMLTHGPYQATPDSADWPSVEKDTKHFPDMVAYMDKCIGQIVEKLEALGIRDNTLIVVTGDNGTGREITSPSPGGPDLKGGKGSMTNAGTHVGFVASWPARIKPGTVVDTPVDFADILPTMADASGAALPGAVDGVSFLPAAMGDDSKARGWIFMSYSKNGPAEEPYRCFVRDQRWKLYDDGKLYDVENDPVEKTPASGEASDAARARLKPRLDRLLAEVRGASDS